MLTPNRPGAIESIVVAIRATMAGGRVRMAVDAKSLILVVTAANPAMSVKDLSKISEYHRKLIETVDQSDNCPL